jgi:hypothetical protein
MNAKQTKLFEPMFKTFDKDAYFKKVKELQVKGNVLNNKGLHILGDMVEKGYNPLTTIEYKHI